MQDQLYWDIEKSIMFYHRIKIVNFPFKKYMQKSISILSNQQYIAFKYMRFVMIIRLFFDDFRPAQMLLIAVI